MLVKCTSDLGIGLGKILVKLAPDSFKEIVEEKQSEPKPAQPQNDGDTKSPDWEYLWATMEIRADKLAVVKRTCDTIRKHQARYEAVSKTTGVPWQVIAVIHNLECGLRFDRHLHCGDPLTARTVRVPAGRPKTGTPPFTWEESAIDALGDKTKTVWNIMAILPFLERYNGLGYRNKGIYSPYLWSFSNHYSKGKYVADGKYDANAVSQQVGAACLLKLLKFGETA